MPKSRRRSESGTGSVAKAATSGAGGKLPHAETIQKSFGAHDISGVTAHIDPEAASSIGAAAFATGDSVAFSSTPTLHQAAEEAAHVVQQRGGTGALKVGEGDDSYEQHADKVADAVVAGESAESLLDQVASASSTNYAQAGRTVQKDADNLPKKRVSGKAMTRLRYARQAIEHTKSLMVAGAGNQLDALRSSKFNSYFRMKVMRDMRYWQWKDGTSSETQSYLNDLVKKYPTALTEAMATLAGGGNCGEHAMVAHSYLMEKMPGETITQADVEGLDHAFILIGDIDGEKDNDLAVSDPWPTAAQACVWEDHFAHTPDKTKINRRNSGVGHGEAIVQQLTAALELNDAGKALVERQMGEDEVEEEIKKGTEGDKPWIWQHADAQARSNKYAYEEAKERDDRPKRQVSGKAMARLNHAQHAIDHTKAILRYGAGNQEEALRGTKWNSYYRLLVMRDMKYWQFKSGVPQATIQYVQDLAAKNPQALTAAMALKAQGGNCGEHAQIAYDYLDQYMPGERINQADVEGLDHAFVIVGDIQGEKDADLAVADPWPTKPVACTWDDHFAYTPDKDKVNVRGSKEGSGENISAQIAAVIELNDEGKAIIGMHHTDEEVDEKIKKAREGDKNWIWDHSDTTSRRGGQHQYTAEPAQADGHRRRTAGRW